METRNPAPPPGSDAVQDVGSNYARVFNQMCHMVALSRTGKTVKVVESLVTRAVVLANDEQPLGTPADVVGALARLFGVTVAVADVERTVEGLVWDGRVVRRNGRYHLRGHYRSEVEAAIQQAEDLDRRVREAWLAEVFENETSLAEFSKQQVWSVMRGYMIRVFREHGAESVQLLDPSVSDSVTESENLMGHADEAMLEAGLPVDRCNDVYGAISRFFDTSSSDRTDWIIQHLDATFTFFALSVPDAAGTYLRNSFQRLDVFVDTNIILELLSCQGDPVENLAGELVAFVRDNSLPIVLLYHDRTRKELDGVIRGIGSALRSQRWPQHVSRAIVKAGSADGIELLYHMKNSRQPVSADVFMRKYEEHLDSLLGDLGLRLYRPKGDDFDEREKHLLVEEVKAYAAEHRPDIRKEYEAYEHDITVWLTVRERRIPASSALQSGAVFLSNDRFFKGFDWNVLRKDMSPAVVLPQRFLQVLRPFGHSNTEYDRRFVKAFEVAAFRSAHRDYADTEAELKSWLASYEDVPEETALRILSDEVLRGELDQADDTGEFAAIVESKMLEINKELRDERDRLRQQCAEADGELAATTAEVHQERAARRVAEENAASLRSEVGDLSGRLDAVEAARKANEKRMAQEAAARAVRRRRSFAVAVAVGVPLLLVAMFQWTGWPHGDHDHRVGIYFGAVTVPFAAAAAIVWPTLRNHAIWVVPALIGLASIL